MKRVSILIVMGMLTATAAAGFERDAGIKELARSELAELEAGASCYYPGNLVLPEHTCGACTQGYATWFYCNTWTYDQDCFYQQGATYLPDCTLTQSPCGGAMTEFWDSNCANMVYPQQWPPIGCSRNYPDANVTGQGGPVNCP